MMRRRVRSSIALGLTGSLVACLPPFAPPPDGGADGGTASPPWTDGSADATASEAGAGQDATLDATNGDASGDGLVADAGAEAQSAVEAGNTTDSSACGAEACSPYACDGGACATACSADTDCAAGFFCWQSACVALTQVSAGAFFTCALTTAGTVQCWGSNEEDEIGIADVDGGEDAILVPTPIAGLSDVARVSSGGGHVCVLNESAEVQCWGGNTFSQLGQDPTQVTQTPVPMTVPGLSAVAQVSSGGPFACATDVGTLYCWGDNTYGELGGGSSAPTSSASPLSVPGFSMLTGVFAAGPQHACAVTGSGTLECWGDGTDGDLGNGMTSQSNAPVPVNGVTNVTKLALGAAHTCALEQSGALYCWGLNSSGQLGNASMQEASSPVPVSGFDAGAIVDVVAGIQHTCALVQAGAVYCWGDNSYGQLGQGNFDLANSATPLLVPSLSSGVTQISAGYQHTCALRRGRVLCWGFNTAGALGNNTTLNSPTPGDVIEP